MIRIGGQDVVGLPPVRRGTAMMFQSYALFPHMTVRRQRRLQPAHARRRQGRAPGAGARDARQGAARPARRPHAGAALGRPAAAGRARARDHHQPARAAAGRAAVGARRVPPAADAQRAAPPATRARHHLRPRHPHPARGDRGGRHGGGDGSGPHRAGGRARGDLRHAGERLRRPFHGRAQRAERPARPHHGRSRRARERPRPALRAGDGRRASRRRATR